MYIYVYMYMFICMYIYVYISINIYLCNVYSCATSGQDGVKQAEKICVYMYDVNVSYKFRYFMSGIVHMHSYSCIIYIYIIHPYNHKDVCICI
jgi:hypothetical protein